MVRIVPLGLLAITGFIDSDPATFDHEMAIHSLIAAWAESWYREHEASNYKDK